MKILTTGLDATTTTFLRGKGATIEEQVVEDVDDLRSWLEGDDYVAAIVHLQESDLGIYAARGLRNAGIKVPIIGISNGGEAGGWSDHRATFLENGGSDLLRDPPSPRELLATIRVFTRDPRGILLDILEYRAGGATLKVNLTRQSFFVNDAPLLLTGQEGALLRVLATNPGRSISKGQLLDQMYEDGINDQPEAKIVDVFVCKIRKKLRVVHPDAKFIKTVWGKGYLMPTQTELDELGKRAG